jgi:hypothetical protein
MSPKCRVARHTGTIVTVPLHQTLPTWVVLNLSLASVRLRTRLIAHTIRLCPRYRVQGVSYLGTIVLYRLMEGTERGDR